MTAPPIDTMRLASLPRRAPAGIAHRDGMARAPAIASDDGSTSRRRRDVHVTPSTHRDFVLGEDQLVLAVRRSR